MVRIKHRYIVINYAKTNISTQDFLALLRKSIQHMHGIHGLAAIESGLAIKYNSQQFGLSIIRIRRGPHQILLSVLPLMKDLSIRTLYTGASIRQCLIFIKKYHINVLEQKAKGFHPNVVKRLYGYQQLVQSQLQETYNVF